MLHELFGKIGMAALAVLLALNLIATFGRGAADKPAPDTKILYCVVPVNPGTNQQMLFRQAGERGS
jgi:hypothetical protein